jgi:hypothetical protein
LEREDEKTTKQKKTYTTALVLLLALSFFSPPIAFRYCAQHRMGRPSMDIR